MKAGEAAQLQDTPSDGAAAGSRASLTVKPRFLLHLSAPISIWAQWKIQHLLSGDNNGPLAQMASLLRRSSFNFTLSSVCKQIQRDAANQQLWGCFQNCGFKAAFS